MDVGDLQLRVEGGTPILGSWAWMEREMMVDQLGYESEMRLVVLVVNWSYQVRSSPRASSVHIQDLRQYGSS